MPARYVPLLRLIRAPAVFTAISNVLAAHLVATAGRIVPYQLEATMAISACLYAAGMIMNDLVDIAEDRRERPERPLPAGTVTLRQAIGLMLAFFALALIIALAAGRMTSLITFVLCALIVAYNALFKATVLGPLVMALCRSGNWLLGLSVSPLSGLSLLLCLPVGLYTYGITKLSRDETTALQRQGLVAITFVLLAAVGIQAWLIVFRLPHTWPLVLWALAAGALVWLVVILWRDYAPQRIQQTITYLLLGMIPADALLAWAGAPWWGGLAVLSLWYPSRRLAQAIQIT